MFCQEMLNCMYKSNNDDQSNESNDRQSESEKQEYSNE